ncbi:MAG TPA: hypothetical protein VMN57_15220 [Anaerolineales bacterium]|nr:hypothetical protein [Anaerolineales bacterium]
MHRFRHPAGRSHSGSQTTKRARRTVFSPAIAAALFWLGLTGCTPAEPAPRITAIPTELLPTSIALTVQAQTTPGSPPAGASAAGSGQQAGETGSAPAPAATATSPLAEAIPSATASLAPRATVSPTPTAAPEIPAAEIEITAPGTLSKVISPIPVRALLIPGDQGRVTIDLLGENGRLLTRQIVVLNPDLGRKAGLVLDLVYEIPVEVELGRLVIYRQDESGRTTALSSVDLVLLDSGQPDYNPILDRSAAVIIQEPLPENLVQGGTVLVSGLARPSAGGGLVAELIGETGQVVGQRVFDVTAGAGEVYASFSVEIPYNVAEPTWVLLIIRERGERIPGIVYLTSTEVLLSP